MKNTYERVRIAVELEPKDTLSLYSADGSIFAEVSGSEPYTLLLEHTPSQALPLEPATQIEKIAIRGLTRQHLSDLATRIVELLS